jgi:hypothetical protein
MMLPLLLLSPFTSFSSSASQFQRMLFGTVTSTLRCSQTYTRAHTPLVDSSNFVCTGLVQAGSFDVCRFAAFAGSFFFCSLLYTVQ